MKLLIEITDDQVCKDILSHNLEPQTETAKVIVEALYNGVLYVDWNIKYPIKTNATEEDSQDEDAKVASIPYTYPAPEQDWKCGYPSNKNKVFSVSYLHQDSITKSDTQV